MKNNIEYSDAIKLIEAEIILLESKLRINQSQNILNKIHRYKQAVKWLKNGQQYNINPKSNITELPPTLVQTPSSEYRIMEDSESDDRSTWVELKIKDQEFRLRGGDIIIEMN